MSNKSFSKLTSEAWDPIRKEFTTVETDKESEADATKYEKGKLKRNASVSDYEQRVSNQFDDDIDELRSSPEMKSIEDFVQYKIDDEDTTFTALELQTLARNIDFKQRKIKNALPPQNIVNSVRTELESYGLKFIPREKIRHFRGAMSSAHGSSPYAGFVGGGSGFSTEKGDPHSIMGLGIGGGMGVIGGGYNWDPNDKKNLPIRGSKR